MEQLKKAVIEECKKDYDDSLKRIETNDGLKWLMNFHGKKYKDNERIKFTRFLEKHYLKRQNEQLAQIDEVAKAEDFGGELIITVEWKKSYMWGSNPRAYTNYGFKGDSIGGCGYCKLSTATAEALNSHKPLLKKLYQAKDEALKDYKGDDKKNGLNGEALGYGVGYNIIPSFEGGVGVSSHQNVCEKVGLSMRQITSTDSTDVFIVSI